MQPAILLGLAAAAGLALVAFSGKSAGMREHNLMGRIYRVHTRQDGFLVIRRYQDQDAITVNITGVEGQRMLHIAVSPALVGDATLSARLRAEMALDILNHWTALGLPQPQGETLGQIAEAACRELERLGAPPPTVSGESRYYASW